MANCKEFQPAFVKGHRPVPNSSANTNPNPSPTLLKKVCYVPAIVAMLTFIGIAAWAYAYEVQISIPLEGFSPVEWLQHLIHPENFQHNFPSGVETYSTSIFMYIYPLAYHLLGVPPETLINWVILLELICYGTAICFLARTLFPDMPWPMVLTLIPLTVASTARDMNLARFGQPFFVGQFYNIADSLRLIGIAWLFNSRPVKSAISMGLSYMTHPALGLMGIIFAASSRLPQVRQIWSKKYLAASIVLLLLIGAWTAFILFSGALEISGTFPDTLWFQYTVLFSKHWYPFQMGFFTILHQERFLPFLCFLMVLFALYPAIQQAQTLEGQCKDKQVVSGMLTMGLLVIAGWIFSYWQISPTLTKLSLHRASDLIITLGWLYVVYGIWLILKQPTSTFRDIARQVLACLILFSPFFFRPAFVWLFASIFSFQEATRQLASNKKSIASWLSLSMQGITLLLAWYWQHKHFLQPWQEAAYTGWPYFWPILLTAVLAVGLLHLGHRFTKQPVLAQSLSLLLITVLLGCYWLNLGVRSAKSAKATSDQYRDAQVWASRHTQKDALFMVDPTIYYGWRDFSQRSSFGNLREWLYHWAYSSNYTLYQEGAKRFSEFQIDPAPYLNSRKPLQASNELSDRVQARFYDWDDAHRQQVATRYGIQYFVLKTKNIRRASQQHVVFKNDSYTILEYPNHGHAN
jgi:hypothetical protein